MWALAIIGTLVCVAAILIGARIITDSLGSSVDVGPSVDDMEVGDCANTARGSIEIVDCDEPHTFQVLSRGTIRATAEITGWKTFEAVARRRCEADFTRIVGRSAVDLGVAFDLSYPAVKVIHEHEGPYTCQIRSATGDRLVGSFTS